jgi:hypothetical protein|tara:strand:+ start:812 stop:1168 length:357 start_codon:yes stop_codon:yes gene_type:complete
MLKHLLFVMIAFGCVKHEVVQSDDAAGLHGFAGENFTSTNSPCLDGIITAIDHSCAVPMEIEEGYPYVTIQCQKTRPGAPPWNKYSIVAVTNPQIEEPSNAHRLCVDPYVRVYLQKHP